MIEMICTVTGASMRVADEERAKRLEASGLVQRVVKPKPVKRKPRKKASDGVRDDR